MGAEMAHIVCIDDKQDILDVTKLCLELVGGYQVSIFRDGRTALQALPTLKPDLILLDSVMPGLSGRETFLALRQLPALQTTPVVFMTARSRPEELKEFIDLGAAGTVAKPFEPDELVNEINKVLNAFTQNQPSPDSPTGS